MPHNFITLSAFSKELLLDSRWLLEGTGKAACTLWHDILRVNPFKQDLFMERSSLETNHIFVLWPWL